MEGNELAELKIHTGNVSFELEKLCKTVMSIEALHSERIRLTTRSIAEFDLEERRKLRVDPVAIRPGTRRNYLRFTIRRSV
jgi:hypothetical protein